MTQFGVVFGPDLLKCLWSYDAPMSWPKLISFYYFFLTYTALWRHFCVGTLWNASAMQRPETVVRAVAQLCLDFASSRVAESMDFRLLDLDLYQYIVWKKCLLSSNPMVLFDNMVKNQSIQGQWPCILQERNESNIFQEGHSKKWYQNVIWCHTFLKQNQAIWDIPCFFVLALLGNWCSLNIN